MATQPVQNESMLTLRQVAEYLGTSEQSVYAMRHRGDGPPAIVLGKRVLRFRRADVDQWIESRLESDRQPA